ncbi:MAG: OmpH family outer membrane protein [Bergeyella sp.]|nr:OmpH family outer membrane protein [Bergeyella sp.]
MKNLSVLLGAVLVFAFSSMNKAQKVATLDVNTILNMMPEKKKIDEKLEAFSKLKGAEIEKKKKEAEALMQKYQKEAATQTQQVNEQRSNELQKLSEQIQQFISAAQKDVAEKTQVEYAPIEKKFNDAVTRAAKANGWDYILDASSPVLIYKNGPDATAAVKKELGL